MPKVAIIAVVVLAVLALGGYFFFSRPDTPQEGTVSDNITDRMSENAIFSGLDTNKPIVCDYTDEFGQTTAYMADNKVRVEGVTDGQSTSAIIDGDTVYFWDPATNEGYSMTITDDMQQMPEQAPDAPLSQDDINEELEQKQADCRNESFDTSLLTPPASIVFQDFTQMMQEQMQQVQDEVPQDVRNQIPEEYQQYLPQ